MHVQEWIKLANRVFKFDGFWGKVYVICCLLGLHHLVCWQLCQLRRFTGGKQNTYGSSGSFGGTPKVARSTTMWCPQDSVQLVYNSNNYGLWYILITIVNGVDKLSSNWGGHIVCVWSLSLFCCCYWMCLIQQHLIWVYHGMNIEDIMTPIAASLGEIAPAISNVRCVKIYNLSDIPKMNSDSLKFNIWQ
jgi:hypothetical protein